MAVTQISRIQNRRGLRVDLPNPLNDAEFGWAEDERSLFIGNGPFHGGNTQILTELTPASLPPYTFISNSSIDAITGFDSTPGGNPFERNANFPVVRSYQNKFDEFVSINDYGGDGDGTLVGLSSVTGTDNAGAFYRAAEDLFGTAGGAFTDGKKRLALHIPAGIYRITRSMLLYPFSAFIGDGIGKTIIVLDWDSVLPSPGPTPEIFNRAVVRTADSEGQIGSDIGAGGAALPTDIFMSGMTLVSLAPQTIGFGLKDVAKIERAERVRFERVRFEGTWESGDDFDDGSRAVSTTSAGGGFVPRSLSFINCEYSGTAYAFNIPDDSVEDVNVVGADFSNHHRAVKLGFDTIVDTTPSGGDPALFRVSHSRFENIDDIGFDNRSNGKGNISTFNFYADNFTTMPVRFDTVSRFSVSLSDIFENESPSQCVSQQLVGPRVQDLGTDNVVMNPQDPFVIPSSGFCGDIAVDGNLTVTGNVLFGSNTFVNSSSPDTFSSGGSATHPVAQIPFALPSGGNVIIVDYGLDMNNTFRNGTLTIIHDGSPGSSTDLNFQDSYIEFNGPPAFTIAVSAEADLGNNENEIDILVDVGGGPHTLSFNYIVRVMTV